MRVDDILQKIKTNRESFQVRADNNLTEIIFKYFFKKIFIFPLEPSCGTGVGKKPFGPTGEVNSVELK